MWLPSLPLVYLGLRDQWALQSTLSSPGMKLTLYLDAISTSSLDLDIPEVLRRVMYSEAYMIGF